jgi:hypothetical protein
MVGDIGSGAVRTPPAPYSLSAVGSGLFLGCRQNWLALAPPLPPKVGAGFWIELTHEFNILASPSLVQPRLAAATVCARLEDLERHGANLAANGGFLCLPERPYVGGACGDASVENLANRNPHLMQLLNQGRVITWTEADLRVPGADRPANPFGLSGMLVLLTRLGAEKIHVLWAEMLVDKASVPLIERRFLGTADVIRALRVPIDPILG